MSKSEKVMVGGYVPIVYQTHYYNDSVCTRRVLFEKTFKVKIFTSMDAGYVYAPYIPIVLTQTVIDASEFTPNILSKYAQKTINPNFYSTINLGEI